MFRFLALSVVLVLAGFLLASIQKVVAGKLWRQSPRA
jgi:hypothetical protein